MTTLYLLGGIVALGGLGIWLYGRSSRRQGAAEAREAEAKHAVENAERIATAVADAPRTIDELDDGVRRGDRLL